MAKASDNEFPSLLFAEQGSAPTTPGTGLWRAYFKSDGLYVVDDAGTETGPLAVSGGGGGASITHKHVNGDLAADHTTTSTSLTDVDADYSITLTGCTAGEVIEVEFTGSFGHSAAGGVIVLACAIASTDRIELFHRWTTANYAQSMNYRLRHTLISGDLTSGSVTVKPRWYLSGTAGTGTCYNGSSTINRAPVFSVTNLGAQQA